MTGWEREVRFHRLMRDSAPSPYRTLRFWRVVAVSSLVLVAVLLVTLLLDLLGGR